MTEDKILKIAKSTILSERNTLTTLSESVDKSIADAIRIIAQSHGKVVITGIGKNQFIAQKLSATFNSTGTSSVFMHATDAIHEISACRLGASAVLDKNEILIGIITDGALRRLLKKHQDLHNITAKDAMSPDPKTSLPEALAREALEQMRTNNITQLLVVEENHYLGVIRIHDILKEGIV